MTANSLPPTTEKPQFVQQLFNTIARRYDLLNDCISFGMHRFWKSQLCRSLKLQTGHHALDVCTGTGDLIRYLLPQVGPEGRVTGLDFSQEMLAVAHQRYPTAKEPRVTLVQGDAMALPFDPASFDAAVVAFGLRNVASIETAVAELAKVVRVGGVVAIMDTIPNPRLPGFGFYFKHVMPLFGRLLAGSQQSYQYLQASTDAFYTPAQLQQVCADAGLHRIQVRTFGFGTVVCITAEKPFI
ncbi:MAG: bifunctional demethylmenaquinone methyltransferase/2-methoxy-6-polyprenyl-1,4-benzoquinol methylase UbiE [Vampirovibrionales bacterium]